MIEVLAALAIGALILATYILLVQTLKEMRQPTPTATERELEALEQTLRILEDRGYHNMGVYLHTRDLYDKLKEEHNV